MRRSSGGIRIGVRDNGPFSEAEVREEVDVVSSQGTR